MNVGWIKLHRKILDCWFWDEKPYDRARAWIDLLLLANHDDKKVSIDGKPVTVKRGQYLTSTLKLSERWGWSRNKTKRFLGALESDGMVNTERTNKGTLVNVVNYSVYQGLKNSDEPPDEPPDELADGHQKDIRRTSDEPPDEPQTKNDKNIKNDKNDKNNNIYIGEADVENAFADFKKMRTRIKKPLTDRAETRARNKLNRLSGNDTRKAILILEQAIYHSWQDLYELKGDFLEEFKKSVPETNLAIKQKEPEQTYEEWVKMVQENW